MTILATSSSQALWYATRATGIVALVLLTATVVLGIVSAKRVRTQAWPGFALVDLHRRVSTFAVAFVAVHVLSAIADPFTNIGLSALVVPFSAPYRRLALGLGTISFDLLLAVALSSAVRGHIKASWWKGIHWLAYVSWPVAVLHAVGTGTDVRFGWVEVLVGGCVVAVAVSALWRFVWAGDEEGTRPVEFDDAPRRIGASR